MLDIVEQVDVSYHDYHRTVIAYHGTSASVADGLVDGKPFLPSENNHDWLGTGIYFWEYAPKQAWSWARKRYSDPAVVGAVIRLGNCFDLLDPENVQRLKQRHALMAKNWPTGLPFPANHRRFKKLDCAVFNHLYSDYTAGEPVDTVRAVYVPTESARRVFKASWIYEEAHIQIAIRNPKNILAIWHVRQDGRYGKNERRVPPPV